MRTAVANLALVFAHLAVSSADSTDNNARQLVQGNGQVKCETEIGCQEAQFGNVFIHKFWVDHSNIYWRCNSPGLIALGFDGGPAPHTADIVNTLDELGVPGTFFVSGERVHEGTGPILGEMEKRGHMIAHNTFHRYTLTGDEIKEQGVEAFLKAEIEDNAAAINPFLAGEVKKYIRPPSLAVDAEIATRLEQDSIKVVMVSINSKDSSGDSSDQMLRTFKSVIEPQEAVSKNSDANSHITLQSDTIDGTANVIAPAVAALKEAGFEFVTVEKCINPSAPEPDTTEVGPFAKLDWGCLGAPCEINSECRSEFNNCGQGEQYCNDRSIWTSDCGDAAVKGCSGDPCRQATMCRSRFGNCGKTEDYCNEESIWDSTCSLGHVTTPGFKLVMLGVFVVFGLVL